MSAKEQVLQARGLLKMMHDDLTDCMMMEVDEWLDALREDRLAHKNDGEPEPNWESYGEWINQICADDGMPALYVEGVEQ